MLHDFKYSQSRNKVYLAIERNKKKLSNLIIVVLWFFFILPILKNITRLINEW